MKISRIRIWLMILWKMSVTYRSENIESTFWRSQALDELLSNQVCDTLVERLSSQYLGQIVQILIKTVGCTLAPPLASQDCTSWHWGPCHTHLTIVSAWAYNRLSIRSYDSISKDKIIMILQRTSWKSSLNLFLRSSAYLLNKVKSSSSNFPTEKSHVWVQQWSVMEGGQNITGSSEGMDQHSLFA